MQDEFQPSGRVLDPSSLFTDQDPALNNKYGFRFMALFSSQLKENNLICPFLIFVSFPTKINCYTNNMSSFS